MEYPILTTSTLLIICVFVYFSFLETFYAGIENLKFEILSFFPRNLSRSAINEPFDRKLIILIKLAFALKLLGSKIQAIWKFLFEKNFSFVMFCIYTMKDAIMVVELNQNLTLLS